MLNRCFIPLTESQGLTPKILPIDFGDDWKKSKV